jgi:hypothetical protein
VAEDEINRRHASTTLGEFYDTHGGAPAELTHGLRRSFTTAGPGQIQRSPSANRGSGGRGQRGRAPSGDVQGRRAQQGGGAGEPC